MPPEPTREQLEICERFLVEPDAPLPDEKLGLGPMDSYPVNGLRHPHEPGTSGWFIWSGEEIDQADPSFFAPLHVGHLERRHPALLPYLALPPGWRFQIGPDYEDVWFDASLLDIE